MDGLTIVCIAGMLGVLVYMLLAQISEYTRWTFDMHPGLIFVFLLVFAIIGGVIAWQVDPGWTTGEEPCAGCGEMISDSAIYCPACGHECIPTCSACGEQIGSEDNYCSECGAEVVSGE